MSKYKKNLRKVILASALFSTAVTGSLVATDDVSAKNDNGLKLGHRDDRVDVTSDNILNYVDPDNAYSNIFEYQWDHLDLINEHRAKNGLQPLEIDLSLSQFSYNKAYFSIENNFFDHYWTENGQQISLVNQYEYFMGEKLFSKYGGPGENINNTEEGYEGVTFATNDYEHYNDLAIRDFINSPPHNSNLLDVEYGRVGLAIVKTDTGHIRTVQYFTTDKPGYDYDVIPRNGMPVFKFNSSATIEEGTTFNPLNGVNVIDPEDGDISHKVVVSTNRVDTSKIGPQVISYSVTDNNGKTVTTTRTINVVPKKVVQPAPPVENETPVDEGTIPHITASSSFNLDAGESFDPMTGVKATDKEDGDITKDVVVKSNTVDPNTVGRYKVMYFVEDSDGLTATMERSVIVNEVVDQAPEPKPVPSPTEKEPTEVIPPSDTPIVVEDDMPVIKSTAKNILAVGDKFDPLHNVVAIDKEDGNITSKLTVVDNPVDVNKPGDYKVVYSVEDSYGNTFTLNRMIRVKQPVTAETTVDKQVVIENDSVKVKEPDTAEESTQEPGTVEELDEIPMIESKGTNNLNVGDQFYPLQNVTAHDKEDGDITKNIKVVSNSVDTQNAGEYVVEYEIVDSYGNKFTHKRDILVSEKEENKEVEVATSNEDTITEEKSLEESNDEVVNNVPRIKSTAVNQVTDEKQFDPMDGIEAVDDEDGELTDKVEVIRNTVNTTQPGEYEVVYSVKDTFGNAYELTRQVVVKGKEETSKYTQEVIIEENNNDVPKIKSTMNNVLAVNESFDPIKSVIATDREDGNITDRVEVVKNTVDTSKSGDYEVVYAVKDSNGNEYELTREVKVVAPELLEKTTKGNKQNVGQSIKNVDIEEGQNIVEGVAKQVNSKVESSDTLDTDELEQVNRKQENKVEKSTKENKQSPEEQKEESNQLPASGEAIMQTAGIAAVLALLGFGLLFVFRKKKKN